MILLLILVLNLTISPSYADSCKENLEYQQNLTRHENSISDFKVKMREEMIDKCPRSKLASSYCKNYLIHIQKTIQAKDNEFLHHPLNKKCATKNQDIIPETRALYTKKNKSGFFIAGAYRDSGTCKNSQQANQACRDVKKELSSCRMDGNYLLVKCQKPKLNSSQNICFEASPILSLLTSPYSVCQVTLKDLEKYAPCLAESAKRNREKLCPRGCSDMPKTKMCEWTDAEVQNYLGCLQIATTAQYQNLCPERKKIRTPKKASIASPIKGCPATKYQGKVKPWKLMFKEAWPNRTSLTPLLKMSGTPREYLALGFKVHKKDFIKAAKDGEDFAEDGEDVMQKAKGSGFFNLLSPPGYTGHKEYSLSRCPGQFEEDEVNSACLRANRDKDKMYWEVNGEAKDSCQLKTDVTYFLNIRYSRGCNWKKNCAVKISNQKN